MVGQIYLSPISTFQPAVFYEKQGYVVSISPKPFYGTGQKDCRGRLSSNLFPELGFQEREVASRISKTGRLKVKLCD
jgi:hypothetical protein